jgi:hypothetical protein
MKQTVHCAIIFIAMTRTVYPWNPQRAPHCVPLRISSLFLWRGAASEWTKSMAGWNFQKHIVALCTPGIRRHKKRRPMSARYNFTVQITREKRLAHGDNAVANFLCCSGFQLDPKRLNDSSLLLQCKQGFGSSHTRGLASFWALWSTCAVNHASNTNGGRPTTLLCSVTSGLQSQSNFNSMGMISIVPC